METRTAWRIGAVVFFASFLVFAAAKGENTRWGVPLFVALCVSAALVAVGELPCEEAGAASTSRPPHPRPTPAEGPKEPLAKPIICADCKHVWNGYDTKEDYLCRVEAMKLEQHVDAVTGEMYYTEPAAEAGGLPLVRVSGPWPRCTTHNTGNCPHFEKKGDDHAT